MGTTPVLVPLVCFGLNGHHFDYVASPGCESSLSGYDTPESFIAEVNAGKYSGRFEFVGATALDKRRPLEKDWRLAIAAPMVNITLGLGEVDALTADRLAASTMAQAVKGQAGNQFGTLVHLQERSHHHGVSPGPLDRVDVTAYVRWWRQRSARVGTICRVDGTVFILWNDSTRVTEIPDQLLLPGTPEPCPAPAPPTHYTGTFNQRPACQGYNHDVVCAGPGTRNRDLVDCPECLEVMEGRP